MSCPDCFQGHKHQGDPKGTISIIHGLPAYVAEPPSGPTGAKGIIVIIPDGFGWEFVNNRLLADHYAVKGGYRVYLPEFMGGHAAPEHLIDVLPKVMDVKSIENWIWKPWYIAQVLAGFIPFIYYNSFGTSWPIVKDFMTSLRQNEGKSLPVGVAGFCWGGKHVVNLAHGVKTPDGKELLIDAGFTAHPSMLKIPDEIQKIEQPVSFALPENDPAIKLPQIKQIEEIVAKQPESYQGEVKIYYGAGHGFAIRADRTTKDVDEKANEAEEQALDWFNRHLKKK